MEFLENYYSSIQKKFIIFLSLKDIFTRQKFIENKPYCHFFICSDKAPNFKLSILCPPKSDYCKIALFRNNQLVLDSVTNIIKCFDYGNIKMIKREIKQFIRKEPKQLVCKTKKFEYICHKCGNRYHTAKPHEGHHHKCKNCQK